MSGGVILPGSKGDRGAVQVIRPLNTQSIAIGATATEIANTIGSAVVQLFSDVACNVAFEASASAATTDYPVGAGFPVFVHVLKDAANISAISTTGTATGVHGTLWVSEAW